MFLLIKHFRDLGCNCEIKAPDVFDRAPGKEISHEEFRHFLMLFSLPLRRSDGIPIKSVQRFDFRSECRVICASVAAANCPWFSCRQAIGHCAYKMENASLTSGRMASVSLVNGKEHRRPRTEVEWNKIADVIEIAARHMNFVQPSLLYFRISDQLRVPLRHHRIRMEAAVLQNARQIFNVRDVIN